MKKKAEISENYLERIPVRAAHVGWSMDDDGGVTLEIENKGGFHWLAQKVFKKPRISYIHLDENGSFIWPLIDGKTNIMTIGESVQQRFGEAANPLYERLAKFFQILHSYGFITWA